MYYFTSFYVAKFISNVRSSSLFSEIFLFIFVFYTLDWEKGNRGRSEIMSWEIHPLWSCRCSHDWHKEMSVVIKQFNVSEAFSLCTGNVLFYLHRSRCPTKCDSCPFFQTFGVRLFQYYITSQLSKPGISHPPDCTIFLKFAIFLLLSSLKGYRVFFRMFVSIFVIHENVCFMVLAFGISVKFMN